MSTAVRNRFCLLTVSLALFASARPLRAAELALNIRPDRDRIYLGETFNLYAEVSGADAGLQPPDLAALPACEFRLLGSNSSSRRSIQFVNGRMFQDVFEGRVFVYAVRPLKDGLFPTGPVTLTHNGRRVTSQGGNVIVTGIQTQDTVIARIQASSENVLVDEPFTLTLTLAIAALPQPYANVEPLAGESPPHLQADFLNLQDIRGLKMPDLKALLEGMIAGDRRTPGFHVNDYRNAQPDFFADPFNIGNPLQPRPLKFRLPAKRMTTGSRAYWEYTLILTYTPLQEGDYTFGPLTFKGPVITGADSQNRALTRDIFTIGPAATVRVVPPTEEGRPDWFVGCVGRDLSVKASFDTDVCKVGDPLTLTLDLTGDISIANMKPLLLSLQPGVSADFRVYDDNIESVPLPNGKRFRYRVRPLRAGTLEFPAVRAAYFDTSNRVYRTVTSAPIPVQARMTTQIVSDTLADSGTNRAARAQRLVALARHTPAAITVSPRALDPDPLIPAPRSLLSSLVAAPVLYLFMIAGTWAWSRREAFAGRRRCSSARRRAAGRLRRGNNLTPADVEAVLRAFLGDRLGVQAQALTPGDAVRLFMDRGVPEPLAAAGGDLLRILDEPRYRPGSSGLPVAFLQEASDWIDAVDGTLRALERKRLPVGRTRWILLAVLIGCGGMASAAPPDSTQSFLWDQANARMACSRNPADYLEAARSYNRLVVLGAESGPVFFNLGTALLLAGDGPNAVAALIRAERRLGQTPAIRSNLRLALALQNGQPDADLPWTRAAFFWHFDLPCRTRIHFAAAGWMLFWLALIVRRGIRHAYGGTGRSLAAAGRVAGLSLFIVFGASALITAVLDLHDRRAWPERVLTARLAGEAQP